MSRCMIYRGYMISSAPTKNGETQWELRILISWEKDGTTNTRPYSTPIGYPTEVEADIQGIALGQRVIDGRVPGISIGE